MHGEFLFLLALWWLLVLLVSESVTLRKPKPPQAKPKLGLLGQAGPGKSLDDLYTTVSYSKIYRKGEPISLWSIWILSVFLMFT